MCVLKGAKLFERYRHALEQCLIRSNALAQPTLVSLQALVLFITMVKFSPLKAPVNSLLATAIALARGLNLHLEHAPWRKWLASKVDLPHPTVAVFTSTELQMRLWWHLVTLDAELAESSKSVPTMLEATWSTRFPGSYDDAELGLLYSMPMPLPVEVSDYLHRLGPYRAGHARPAQRTDASFALVRMAIMHYLKCLMFPEEFWPKSKGDRPSSTEDRVRYLDKLIERVNDQYLSVCQRHDPQSFFERNAIRVVLSKHLMLANHNVSANQRRHDCAQVLIAAAELRKFHPKWAWLIRQTAELDALELLWELLSSPPGPGEPVEADEQDPWVLAEVATNSGKRDDMEAHHPDQWSRILQLRECARESRQIP